jgi:hypothetical protein
MSSQPASLENMEGSRTDLQKQGTEPVGDAGDPYNGYDRFGRTQDIRWQTTT